MFNPWNRLFRTARRLRSDERLSRLLLTVVAVALLVPAFSCKHGHSLFSGEVMYVSAPQANLRDRIAAVYNRTGSVNNGERVEVLERQKRFVRIRTANKVEGWIELRALVPRSVFEQFEKLKSDNRSAPVMGRATTRTDLNMHVTPGRETDTLYQLTENTKVELLRRATAQRATPEEIAAKRAENLARLSGDPAKPTPKRPVRPVTPPNGNAAALKTQPNAPLPSATPHNAATIATSAANSAALNNATGEPQPRPMDDWWLVRDAQGRVGWVLAHMIDADIPLEVLQYAEGQRVQAAFVLNKVQDAEKGEIAQYLVLFNENKDGLPYDFNQVRVFSWNLKRHRYETAYRERNLMGYFPATVSVENFGKEGYMPVFTILRQNPDGSRDTRKFRLIGNVVRQVQAPGVKPQPTPRASRVVGATKELKKVARKAEQKVFHRH